MFHITQLCNVSHYIIVSHLLLLPNTTYSTVVQMCLCEGAIGRLFKHGISRSFSATVICRRLFRRIFSIHTCDSLVLGQIGKPYISSEILSLTWMRLKVIAIGNWSRMLYPACNLFIPFLLEWDILESPNWYIYTTLSKAGNKR